MISVRAVDYDELLGLGLFASEYATNQYLKLETGGDAPSVSWTLTTTDSPLLIRRRLDRGTPEALVELYGPAQQLRFIAALHEDNLAGLITWKYEAWSSMVWLLDIRVRMDRRREGVAGRMLEDLLWSAARLEARGVMLETQNTNYPAVRFYLAKRFTLVGLNTHLYATEGRTPAEFALYFFRALE